MVAQSLHFLNCGCFCNQLLLGLLSSIHLVWFKGLPMIGSSHEETPLSKYKLSAANQTIIRYHNSFRIQPNSLRENGYHFVSRPLRPQQWIQRAADRDRIPVPPKPLPRATSQNSGNPSRPDQKTTDLPRCLHVQLQFLRLFRTVRVIILQRKSSGRENWRVSSLLNNIGLRKHHNWSSKWNCYSIGERR